ncbi:MAG TPA: methyltransferase domain-containing protein [Edaphobacter sp.]|nr:methyltransferase domain-containing protein [Edaphobacter sp.]
MTRAGATIASPTQADASVFDLWAQVYDAQSNPLLLLEERCAMPLLPPLRGKDVLDVGCGTGRWLKKLETFEPASLTGTDCSTAMLEYARAKVRRTTILEHGQCSALPGEDASRSFVLASFILSYIDDLQGFARECARILRPEGWMLISDMHPATAAERGWKRSFHVDGATVDIAAHSRSLAEIIAIFKQNGFEASVLIEPAFEEPEELIFEHAGKLAQYEELAGVAAIYISKLQKQTPRMPLQRPANNKALQLANARIGRGPIGWSSGDVLIEDGRVTSIREDAKASAPILDLAGYALLPGLINSHEHLEFGLFPKLGRPAGAPSYRNSTEWAKEIHQVHSAVIERYRQIPKTTQLWWGAIRNLLCGVTTVCHHNPLHEDLTVPDFPVRVLSRFSWSHSLAFDPNLTEKFQRTPREQPFILHAAEGMDEESRNELSRLDQMQVLDERTVLVHGLGCTAREISLINRRGASLVVCPTSNRFLFEKTLSRDLLASVERVALGSDSPITAVGDLLDEVHYLYAEAGLDPSMIYSMVTSSPAEMFHLKEGQGRIAESGVADLIAVRDRYDSPAGAISELTFGDVELVLLAGRVQMASPHLYARLPYHLRPGMELIEVAGHQRWIRAPLQALFESAESVLGQKKLLLAGREVRYLGTL